MVAGKAELRDSSEGRYCGGAFRRSANISPEDLGGGMGGDLRDSYPSASAGIPTEFSLILLRDATWNVEGTVCFVQDSIVDQFSRPLTRPHEG